MDRDAAFRKQKKILKDVEPVKDQLSELTEEEPKNIEDIKKRLSKKFKE